MSDAITVQVEATTSEMIWGNRQATGVIFSGWRRIVLVLASLGYGITVLVVAVTLFLLLLKLPKTPPGHFDRFFALWPFAVMLVLLPFLIVRVRMFFGFVSRSRFGLQREYLISQRGIEVKAPGGLLRVDWSGVEAVRQSRKLIVIVYSNMFMVLPKWCFPSDEAAHSAYRKMCHWREETLP